MRKSVDFFLDDHPDDDPERARSAWAVAILDDCETCDDLRVEVTIEAEGGHGTGVSAHLGAAGARRLRAALGAALREIGEDAGP